LHFTGFVVFFATVVLGGAGLDGTLSSGIGTVMLDSDGNAAVVNERITPYSVPSRLLATTR
jgi:hypothetical protein